MSKKSKSQLEIETNFIRQYMNQNLELGKSHHEICEEFRHIPENVFPSCKKNNE